jgi:hypothetical protein
MIKYDTEGIDYQDQFHNSEKPKVYLSTGFGGGKTYSLVMKLFKLMNINRLCAGGILSPTFKMYKRDVVPTIKTICKENGIRYKYNRSDAVWFFPDTGSMIYAFTAEDPDSIKGPNLAFFVINEVTLCSEEAFLMALGRVRLKQASLLQVAMSGTPESFNWAYEYFISNPRTDTDLIFGDARKNTHIAASFFQTLADSYDELMQAQYIEGKFVNMSGKRAVWAFNRHKHASRPVQKISGLPVWVSLDFNVNPMAATLWNPIPLGEYEGVPYGIRLRAFDELNIESSNTYEVCDALNQRLERDSHGTLIDRVTIYPDPAGRAKSTKTRNLSDFDILREQGFREIKFKPSISVRDCLNATNGIFSRNEVELDPVKCRQTIADLEQCVLKDDVFEIVKSNPKRSHWVDGTKNMIDFEFPVRRRGYMGSARNR